MSVIYLYGDIGVNETVGVKGFTLQDVISMVAKLGEFESLTVRIKSRGGSVQVGYDIFNYLRSLGKEIITIADGEVASIATVIFLAGAKRVMSKDSYLIIHNPWANVEGEADFLIEYAKSLKATEGELISFYSTETGHPKEAIQPLMRDETKISAEQSVSLGFATEIESTVEAPLAFIGETKIKKDMSKEHLTKEEADKKFGKLEGMLNSLSKIFKGKTVALVLQDGNGTELDFPDLAEGDVPKVDDKATVDGAPASGEFVMPSGETYVFADGVLTEIKPVAGEENDDEEKAQLKTENEDLKRQNAELTQNLSDVQASVAGIQKEMLNLKKSVGSSFNYSGKPEGKKEEFQENKSRSLFRKDDK